MASKYLEFAQVRQGRDEKGNPNGTYIKVIADVNLKEGTTVYKDTPQDKVRKLVELGFIDEATAEERIAKIPDYILQVLTVKND